MTPRQFLEDHFGKPLAALVNTSVIADQIDGVFTATFLGLVDATSYDFDAVIHLDTAEPGDLKIIHLTRLHPLKNDPKEDSRLTEKVTIEEKLP